MELVETLKQIYGLNKEVQAISLEDYQALFKELTRDEIQIVIPKDKADMFSEEIMIMVSNILVGGQNQKFELKVLNSDHLEIERHEFMAERVSLVAANRAFIALYTNR